MDRQNISCSVTFSHDDHDWAQRKEKRETVEPAVKLTEKDREELMIVVFFPFIIRNDQCALWRKRQNDCTGKGEELEA